MKIKYILQLLIVFSLLIPSAIVVAEEEGSLEYELNLLRSGVFLYSPGDSSVGQAFQCNTGSFIGSENTEIAFNYFRSIGLNDAQAGGIVGNLIHESNVNPLSKQGGNGTLTFSSVDEIVAEQGFGIAQWTAGSRQEAWLSFAEAQGKDPLSLELQLEFLLQELETQPDYGYEELQAANDDIAQATWIFLAFFEKPATVDDADKERDPVQPTSGPAKTTLDERLASARSVVDSYGGGASPSIDGGCAIRLDFSQPSFAAISNVQIDDSPPGAHKESNCTGTFTPGAASLQSFIAENFSPPVTSIGGYRCRSMVGGERTSIHGLGRALDIMVDANTPEGLETGDKIRNMLYNNAEILGIQRIIWNRSIWSADKSGWRSYTGDSPHTDHLHIEINLEASNKQGLAG